MGDTLKPANQNIHLLLMGGQRTLPRADNGDDFLIFYGSLFDRLKKEVKNLCAPARYVGFQSQIDDNYDLHFLGMEVHNIQDIPKGMAAWELDGKTWTILEPIEGCDRIVSKQNITWLWAAGSRSAHTRWTVEFAGRLPKKLCGQIQSEHSVLWVSANAYVDLCGGEDDTDNVVLID